MSFISNRPAGVPYMLLLSVAIGSIGLFSLVRGGLQNLGFNSTAYSQASPDSVLVANPESLAARLKQTETELQQVKLSEKQKNDALWDASTQLTQTQQVLSAKEQELAAANQQIQAFQTELTNKTQEIHNLNGSIAQLHGESEILATCVADINELLSSVEQLNLLSAPGRLYNLINSFTLREGACSRASVLIPNILTKDQSQAQVYENSRFRRGSTLQANVSFGSHRVSPAPGSQAMGNRHFRRTRLSRH